MVFLEPIGTQYFSCSRVMHQHLNMGRHAQDLLYTVQTDPDTLYSLAALRHSKLFLSKTNAQSEHTHLLLLLLCGDAGAAANPGPHRSPVSVLNLRKFRHSTPVSPHARPPSLSFIFCCSKASLDFQTPTCSSFTPSFPFSPTRVPSQSFIVSSPLPVPLPLTILVDKATYPN